MNKLAINELISIANKAGDIFKLALIDLIRLLL